MLVSGTVDQIPVQEGIPGTGLTALVGKGRGQRPNALAQPVEPTTIAPRVARRVNAEPAILRGWSTTVGTPNVS